MKAFFLLVLLFLVFFAIGSSSVARVDLTPDTPPALVQQDIQTDFVPQPQVIQINESEAVQAQEIPVTGACTDPYIVRAGDSLSLIAALCNTSVGAIRLANPQITNINLIYPGQALDIPGGAANPQPAPVPVTGVDKMEILPVPTATPLAGDTALPLTGQAPVIRPGTVLEVKAVNYPPNTTVSIGIMPDNGPVTILTHSITDVFGSATTNITLPLIQDTLTRRVVIVSTSGDGVQHVQAVSDPFYIGDNP
jgi:LysM repeat protein